MTGYLSLPSKLMCAESTVTPWYIRVFFLISFCMTVFPGREGRWSTEPDPVSRSSLSPPLQVSTFQFSSVAQSCLTLCDPIDYSTPGFPVHHQPQSLLKLMFIKLMMPSNHLILCCPLFLLPSIFPSMTTFSKCSQFFASGGQSIRVSASTSVLPMNTQD